MKRLMMLLLAIALSMGSACTGGQVRETTVAEAAELIGGGAQLLDVRTEEEWNEGRIEGATRIGIAGDDFVARAAKELDPSKPVVVYCRSGNRSAQAARKLEKLGFKTIYDLKGGIKAWLADGRTVVK
ncbi:MAG TPA: rhodanese-like domain-containing protein [Luteolibacter sp.]|nr:rhodanese-like domain-containing protein [Luteolibacter sp.]